MGPIESAALGDTEPGAPRKKSGGEGPRVKLTPPVVEAPGSSIAMRNYHSYVC